MKRSPGPRAGCRIASAAALLLPFVGALALTALITLTARPAVADLASGGQKLTRGDYKGAIADLAKVSGKPRAQARQLLVQAEVAVGDLAAAEKEASALARDKDAAVAADGTVLLATVERQTGRYAEARALLEPLVQRNPKHLGARHLLGLIQLDVGDKVAAVSTFQKSIDEFDAQTYDTKNPRSLFYLAESARYLGQYDFANDSFREAVSLDPTLTEAGVEWGYLFLQKYATGDAEQTFDEVFKFNPNHPDAHAGAALVSLEKTYDLRAVDEHLKQALAVNPRHLPSLLARASVEIDQNQWDAARATIGQVLAVNPNQVQAHAMLATVSWLRDDSRAYEAERQKAFAINPAYAQFYRIVARSAVREHRYPEAIQLELEALKVDPKMFEAMEGVGSGYLRMGQEKEGLEWLRKSWEGDAFNLRTYNTLNLFEETIAREYGFTSSKTFKFRYHNDEAKVLHRYLAPVLEKAYEEMAARYGFRPPTPLTIELYENQDDYSIRTVGLPNLGALGVCFGRVITAMSPTEGDINWGMVLWHELGHVFAIQLSKSRVPRWFTEGLSEYETLIARPEWSRENDADLYAAMADGAQPSVAELNWNFVTPDMQTVVVAYYQSAVTIEYIARTYGFPKIVAALKLFGQGKETPEVIQSITGKTVAQFDAEFRSYLEKRLAPYKGTFHLPTGGHDDLVTLEKAVDARPDEAAPKAAMALGHFYEGNANEAMKWALEALGKESKNAIARYVLAELALRREDFDEAKHWYSALVGDGIDSFDIRGRLALIAKQQGNLPEAARQLCAAKRLDPERSYPYQELYEIYNQMGNKDKALAELETYVTIEQMQYAPVKQLVDEYATRGNWRKVRTYGELALFINPSDADLFLKLGRAYLESGNPDKALFTYDSALLAKPDIRRPALAHIGRARAYELLKQPKKARAAVDQALKTEAENAEALALKKRLPR